MYVIVTDDYSHYGLWLKGMMVIEDDGTLRNIRRDDQEGFHNAVNLLSLCSSKDVVDVDLYDVDSEERLVYLKETAKRRIVNGKPELYDIKIELTFNKLNEHRSDEVVAALKKSDDNIVDIKVSSIDTFVVEEAVTVVKEWTGMDFNPETNELSYEDGPAVEECSTIECKEDELPF